MNRTRLSSRVLLHFGRAGYSGVSRLEHRVNWEAIAAVAEILGSLAVVVSLGYVASQIRQSARESKRNVYRSVKTEIQEFRAMIAQSAQVARIYREGLKQSSELNEDDRWRFGALMQHQFSTSEDV